MKFTIAFNVEVTPSLKPKPAPESAFKPNKPSPIWHGSAHLIPADEPKKGRVVHIPVTDGTEKTLKKPVKKPSKK